MLDSSACSAHEYSSNLILSQIILNTKRYTFIPINILMFIKYVSVLSSNFRQIFFQILWRYLTSFMFLFGKIFFFMGIYYFYFQLAALWCLCFIRFLIFFVFKLFGYDDISYLIFFCFVNFDRNFMLNTQIYVFIVHYHSVALMRFF